MRQETKSNAAGFFRISVVLALLCIGLVPAMVPQVTRAAGPLDFTGRWGTQHVANWDLADYEVTFSADQNHFPWDFISFVGQRGAISLCGHPDIADTFAWSSSSALAGAGTGDLLRVKGPDAQSYSHITKIGLVIGTGSDAERAWFSSGTIDEYYLAPESVGYRATVLGRSVTVRLSHLTDGADDAVGVIEVSIDDPTDARIYFVTDLEPAVHEPQAFGFISRPDTLISYDDSSESLAAYNEGGSARMDIYMYSSEPLASWSGTNLAFDTYLNNDVLDEQVLPTASDGRSAFIVQAEPTVYFYVGSSLLSAGVRQDPTAAIEALGAERVSALDETSVIHSSEMPSFELVNLLSNLFNAYLINPDGAIYYCDRAFLYGADSLMPIVSVPELLPTAWVSAYTQGLDYFGDNRYTSPTSWRYAEKYDIDEEPRLPSWYTGGIPGYILMLPDGSLDELGQWSDLYETAQYITGVYRHFQVTGDQSFVGTQQAAVLDALDLLKRFETEYESDYGPDGDQYPNVLYPMAGLGGIAGTYPGETGATIEAYRSAEQLLRLWSMDAEADDLANNYIAPMVAGFDAFFWDAGLGFYTGVADENSLWRTPGTWYQDKWTQAMLPPLLDDVGTTHLAEMVDTFVTSGFYDLGQNVHWLSPDSENWCEPGCWGTDPRWTNGFRMEGGFYNGLPGVVTPLAYYQLGEGTLGNQYANYYFDVWLTHGPYESMYEWDYQLPGLYRETSIYIESANSTIWLLKKALGLSVGGLTVTIVPALEGEFSVENLHVTSQGLTAVLDYWREANGAEYVRVVNNEGLTIYAPNASPTAVTLASFQARAEGHAARLTWETVSEVDVLGFNLYRSERAGDVGERLNRDLLPCQACGTPGGAAYSKLDPGIVPGTEYYYTIEVIGMSGMALLSTSMPFTLPRFFVYLPVLSR
ncbi:MAG: hypothetical protein JXA93_01725 [Anaerolineae bacterium]|nr:hypothetical protein [Anaerolineae bacterium]